MINYRFLDYKTGAAFDTANENHEVLDEAIAFIKEEGKSYIWARGKKHYTLEEDYESFVEWIKQTTLSALTAGNLIDITDNIISCALKVDTQLSNSSTNPVENKAIYEALATKGNMSDVRKNTSDILDIKSILNLKLNILKEGYGISIKNDKISVTLDTSVYVLVDGKLSSVDNPREDKIYLVEDKDEQGSPILIQYRYKDGEWKEYGSISPTIDLDGYLTEDRANSLYQPKGDYLTRIDLSPYATTEQLNIVNARFNDYVLTDYIEKNYALKSYVDSTFVKKVDVYTPNLGNDAGGTHTDGGSSNTSWRLGGTFPATLSGKSTTTPTITDEAIIAELNKKADKEDLLNYTTTEKFNEKIREIENKINTGGSTNNNMVTLTVEEYQTLVDNDLVVENTYYFTYEKESWGFGEIFPITLS